MPAAEPTCTRVAPRAAATLAAPLFRRFLRDNPLRELLASWLITHLQSADVVVSRSHSVPGGIEERDGPCGPSVHHYGQRGSDVKTRIVARLPSARLLTDCAQRAIVKS